MFSVELVAFLLFERVAAFAPREERAASRIGVGASSSVYISIRSNQWGGRRFVRGTVVSSTAFAEQWGDVGALLGVFNARCYGIQSLMCDGILLRQVFKASFDVIVCWHLIKAVREVLLNRASDLLKHG